MGNCFQESEALKDEKQQSTNNSEGFRMQKEVRSMPPISKQIMNRLEQLGPYDAKQTFNSKKIYKLANNSFYNGNFKNDKLQGAGQLLFPDGTLVESDFEEGIPSKKTRIIKTNGEYFEGFISDESEEIVGVIFENGIRYEGSILNKKPHGEGKETSKVFMFEGKYVNGKKVSGLLQWNAQGSTFMNSYQGGFENNEFSGPGTLINEEGKFVGNFEQGMKSGHGVLELPSGKRYEGFYRNNKPSGSGKLTDESGRLSRDGYWCNGKFISSSSK